MTPHTSAGFHPCHYEAAGCTVFDERNCGIGRWICGWPLLWWKRAGEQKSTSGRSPLQNRAGHIVLSAFEGHTQHSESNTSRDPRSIFCEEYGGGVYRIQKQFESKGCGSPNKEVCHRRSALAPHRSYQFQ